MFRRLLVPTDLTDATLPALSAVLNLAPQAAHIDLLHVIERIPNVPDAELRVFYDRLEHDAHTRMRSFVETLQLRERYTVECHVALGRRADDIVRFSQSARSDLILLQHRPNGALLGSLSYRVSVLAPCSVLLLKNA